MEVEKTFWVWKKIDNKWIFWFNGRGKSSQDLLRRIRWASKVPAQDIKITTPPERLK